MRRRRRDREEEVAAFLASGDRVTRVLKAYGDALDAGFKSSNTNNDQQRSSSPFSATPGCPAPSSRRSGASRCSSAWPVATSDASSRS